MTLVSNTYTPIQENVLKNVVYRTSAICLRLNVLNCNFENMW